MSGLVCRPQSARTHGEKAELRDALKMAGIPLTKLELRRQGWKDGGEDVRLFRTACIKGEVTPLRSLVLTSGMSEARVTIDATGNSKLAKGTEGGRRLKARDDSVAAAILSVGLGRRRARPESKRGRYLGVA